MKEELKRYNLIVDYFENNKDRIYLKENQTHLTRLYTTLINQKGEGFKNLANKISSLVKGPNFLLGHWEELERLEEMAA